jgi:hypothetical protein
MIMKTLYKVYLVLFITLLFFSSCTTSKYVVSDSANIEKYKYASINEVMGYTGSPKLMDMDVQIFNIVASSDLEMIGEKEISNLSKEEQNALLLVKYSATQSEEESVVSITFVDYLTLRPVATCRGAFGLGLNESHDMKIALNKAKEQVKKLFNKIDKTKG